MLKRLRTRRFFVVLIILVISVAGIYYYKSRKETNLDTSTIQKGDVEEVLILSGSVDATEFARMPFLTSGELQKIYVNVGDRVTKGQLLLQLDSVVSYQQYLQAEAGLRSAQATLDRVYDGLQDREKDETFTQIETRTAAETAKDSAYRTFVIAQKNLSNSTLRAPFDGIVTNIENPFTGVNTSLTQAQIEIINPDTIYFKVAADQSEVTKINIGQQVRIELDAFDDQFYGNVRFVGFVPESSETGAVYAVYIDFIDKDKVSEIARAGMTGDATFTQKEKKNVLFVDPQFIQRENGDNYLLVDKPNNKVYVEVGLEGEDRVEVSGDINEGQTVYDK